MRLGMIGLGKMGGNMAARLREKGHEVVGYDVTSDQRDVDSPAALVARLEAPRVVWVMVPAGDPTSRTVAELGELLGEGDLVIEGGNTHYADDRARAETLAAQGIGYLDVGVSGGVWGRQNGYGIMVGGEAEQVEQARPSSSPSPRRGAAGSCTPGRSVRATSSRWSTTASSTG